MVVVSEGELDVTGVQGTEAKVDQSSSDILTVLCS